MLSNYLIFLSTLLVSLFYELPLTYVLLLGILLLRH